MRNLICLLALLGAWLPLLAQPGGGGGLVVRAVYVPQGGRLVPATPAVVQLRLFGLADTTAQAGLVYEHPALLARHPHEPELLLARACAHLSAAYLIAGNNSGYDRALAHYQAALAAAQRRGIAGRRAGPYRRQLQKRAAEYDRKAHFRYLPSAP